MDRGALWTIVHAGYKEKDTTERLTLSLINFFFPEVLIRNFKRLVQQMDHQFGARRKISQI